MMQKTKYILRFRLLLIGALLCLSVSMAQAEEREIRPLQQWRSRVNSVMGAQAPAGGFIVGQEELDKLWIAWQIPGNKPAVDFKTQLLLVRTCNCSLISVAPLLNDQGDLHIQVTVTKDIREGTAYVIVLIPRHGIKTIEGKPLE
ncbi:MAG: hypothetical protein NTW80_00065 [Deltaproteobacteria bacterium]|nr:hypothetical protein [Deltaproteobacteria bacterium]